MIVIFLIHQLTGYLKPKKKVDEGSPPLRSSFVGDEDLAVFRERVLVYAPDGLRDVHALEDLHSTNAFRYNYSLNGRADANSPFSIAASAFGSPTECRDSQTLDILPPIFLMELGITIVLRVSQPVNASSMKR